MRAGARHRLVIAAIGAACAWPTAAACAVPNSTPEPTYATDGPVDAVVRSVDTIYLGGSFTRVGPPTGPLASIDLAGAIAPAIPTVAGAGALVDAIAPDGSGGFYIGGDFTSVGGAPHKNLAHIRADGSLDPSWDPSTNANVSALAASGSTVFVGGSFNGTNSVDGSSSRNYLAALDATTGAVAPGFNPNPNGFVDALSVAGTTLYAGGNFSGPNAIGGQSRGYAAALDTGTGAVQSWNPNLDGSVLAIATSGSGATTTIYVGGNFGHANGATIRNRAAAFDASGTVTGWNPDADSSVDAIAVTPGAVYIGGFFTHVDASVRVAVAETDPSTGIPTSWTAGVTSAGTPSVASLAVVSGALYLGGNFDHVTASVARRNLAAVTTSAGNPGNPGSALPWNPSANGGVDALAEAGGRVIAGGSFTLAGGTPRTDAAAINAADGTVTGWSPEPNGEVDALAVDGDTVYLGGQFTALGSGADPRSDLAAVNATTGAVSPWHPDPNGPIRALTVASGTLYIGGAFITLNGISSFDDLAAFNLSSGAVTGFAPDILGPVNAIAVSNGTVYAGGNFQQVGGATRHFAAAFDGSGVLLPWNPDVDGVVSAVAAGNGAIYLGGAFLHVNTAGNPQPLRYLAAVDPTTGAANTWAPEPDSGVNGLAADGATVYAAGLFGKAGGQARHGFAAIDAGTGTATAWNPAANGGSGLAVTVAADGTVYGGGGFDTIGTVAQPGFAAFGVPPTSTSPPTVVGRAAVGQPLACIQGGWSGSTPQSYAVAWLHDGTPISDATSSDYTPTPADGGHHLSCRITAQSLAGHASADSAAVTVPSAHPVLSKLSIRPSSFKAAPRGGSIAAVRERTGATVAYTDSQTATTAFTVLRVERGIKQGRTCGKERTHGKRAHHPRTCRRLVAVGRFTHADRAGRNTVRFTGRVHGRALARGRYQLSLTAHNANGASKPLAGHFSIRRR